jgi:hypothetical protein
MTKLRAGLSYEGKVEHIIEQVVLNVIPPDCASPADIRAAIRELCKACLRLNGLELPSDAVIDEIASEMIDWHAPRPHELGWNPDLAEAPSELRLMARNRRRADIAAEERQQEPARFLQEREAEHEHAAQQDKFQRVRENAAQRRSRGDHEGADFLEKWIANQERAR